MKAFVIRGPGPRDCDRETLRRHKKKAWDEIQRGRLRVGWSWPEVKALNSKEDWIAGHQNSADGKRPTWKESEREYRKTKVLSDIEDGDLLIIPKLPDDGQLGDDRITIAVARQLAPRDIDDGSPSVCVGWHEEELTDDDFHRFIAIKKGATELSPRDVRWLKERNIGKRSYPVNRFDDDEVVQRLAKVVRSGLGRPSSSKQPEGRGYYDDPTDESSYELKGTVVRTPREARLLKRAKDWLTENRYQSARPDDTDLVVRSARRTLLIEGKAPGSDRGKQIKMVREAIGQLFWYRMRHRLDAAELTVLIDSRPHEDVVALINEIHSSLKGPGMHLIWWDQDRLTSAKRSQKLLKG